MSKEPMGRRAMIAQKVQLAEILSCFQVGDLKLARYRLLLRYKLLSRFSMSLGDDRMKTLEPMKVIRLAGSRAELARLLGIGRSAISQWRKAVPAQRVWQLRVQRGEWFDANGDLLPVSSVQAFDQPVHQGEATERGHVVTGEGQGE